jgi:hypothetical protein
MVPVALALPVAQAVPVVRGAQAGSTPPGLGDPNNPTSIAYFNQTVGDRVLFAVDQATLSPEGRDGPDPAGAMAADQRGLCRDHRGPCGRAGHAGIQP